MRRIICCVLIVLSLCYLGCKVTVFTFNAPTSANTGTIISMTITGEVFDDDEDTRTHGIILQIPEDWRVMSAEAVDQNGAIYSFSSNMTYASRYTPEPGHKIWVGTNLYSALESSTKTVTTTLRVLTGNFTGNLGEQRPFTIKAAAGVYRSGQWVTDDPENQYSFVNITDDKYVETITVQKVADTTAPASIASNQIRFAYCACNDRTITVDWGLYNEEAEEDVVSYNIYRCSQSPYSGSCVPNYYGDTSAGIQEIDYRYASVGIEYFFWVTAVDEAGNESSIGTSASFIPQENIWDVKGDGKITLEEAIHALQIVAGMR